MINNQSSDSDPQNIEKFRRPDGTIDFGARATFLHEQEMSEIERRQNAKTLPLHDLHIFQLADKVSDIIWEVVSSWEQFSKKTIGDQIVRATDSIGANIAEGYGRYFFSENLLFLYYSRGSLYETMFWLEKAKKRKLVNDEKYLEIKKILDVLPLELNKVIKIVRTTKKTWKNTQ